MSGHTPGPSCDELLTNLGYVKTADHGGGNSSWEKRAETTQNERRLMEALRELLDWFDWGSSETREAARNAAESIIIELGSTPIEWNYVDGVWYRKVGAEFEFYQDVRIPAAIAKAEGRS